MVKRKCPQCKEYIYFEDAENSIGAVFYNGKYYHEECFVITCNKKMKSKKQQTLRWDIAINEIPKLKKAAKEKLAAFMEKDEFYHFALDTYQISKISDRQWQKLSHIFDGTYPGLTYKISPEELLEEWRFYLPELFQSRIYKDISGNAAFAYDLAIVLSKNAEYREMKERKKLEDQAREARKNSEVQLNSDAMFVIKQISKKRQLEAAQRRAALFEEETDNVN